MSKSPWRTPMMVLACGSVLLAISVGLRHGFGLFLQPMSAEHGWGREVFGFAIALQNLIWGASQPFTGMLADRHGAGRLALVGAALYVIGLVAMANAHSAAMLIFSAGVLIGLGLSCTTFATVFAAIGRALPPEKRSAAMGLSGAIGSFGQFLMLPVEQTLITFFGWSMALMLMALIALAMVPLATTLLDDACGAPAPSDVTVGAALREAFAHKGFLLLSAGYFVCGFHVTFVGTHLPAYLSDRGLSANVGTTVLALVGLFNIVGSYLAGQLGARFRKPLILSALYFYRFIVIGLFAFVVPVSEWSAYAFAIALGITWLATVPLTSGTIMSLFGVRNLSMLGGITFFCHQVGAFLGGWLGGSVYDRTGSYDAVWIVAMLLGLLAAALNWPIKERPVERLAAARAS
jgi:MFS family permease